MGSRWVGPRWWWIARRSLNCDGRENRGERSHVLKVLMAIADSKTANGIGDMPLTDAAIEAFRRQIEKTRGSEYLFPSPKATAQKPYMTNFRKIWAATLKKAGVPYLCSVRTSAYVCYPVERGWCRRSHGHANVKAERRRRFQAVRPGEAQHDARGAWQAGPAGERARNSSTQMLI